MLRARQCENTQRTPVLHYIYSLFIYSPLWLPQVRYLSHDSFFSLSCLVFRGAKEKGGASSKKFLHKLRRRLTKLTFVGLRAPFWSTCTLWSWREGSGWMVGLCVVGVVKENRRRPGGRGVAAVRGVKQGGIVSLQRCRVSPQRPRENGL